MRLVILTSVCNFRRNLVVGLTALSCFLWAFWPIFNVSAPIGMLLQTALPTPPQSSTRSPNYNAFKEQCSRVLQQSNCANEVELRKLQPNNPWHDMKFDRDVDMTDLRKVLLVVQFNEPFYITSSKVYEMYSRVFADVVFCGPEEPNELGNFWPISNEIRSNPNFTLLTLSPNVRFVAYGKPKIRAYGENGYYCVNLALEGYPNVDKLDGIMFAADDLILNFWEWKKTGKSLQKNWIMTDQFTSDVAMFEVDTARYCNGTFSVNSVACGAARAWEWAVWFKASHLGWYNEVELRAKKMGDPFWSVVLKNLTQATNGTRRMFRDFADTFYITKSYFATVLPLFQLMNKHRVFGEVAVVTALKMATAFSQGDLIFINATAHDWGVGLVRRRRIIDAYLTNYELVHPVKWSLAFREWPQPEAAAKDRAILPHMTGTNAGAFMQNDASVTCVYCYLLEMSNAYAEQLYDS